MRPDLGEEFADFVGYGASSCRVLKERRHVVVSKCVCQPPQSAHGSRTGAPDRDTISDARRSDND
jgi:hypothetical protein